MWFQPRCKPGATFNRDSNQNIGLQAPREFKIRRIKNVIGIVVMLGSVDGMQLQGMRAICCILDAYVCNVYVQGKTLICNCNWRWWWNE